MATSLLKSFIEVVNPAAGQAGKKMRDPQGRKAERKMRPQAGQTSPQVEPTSKAVLEVQSAQVD